MKDFPKHFYIEVDRTHPEIAEWFNRNSQTAAHDYHTVSSGYLYYPNMCGFHHYNTPSQFGYSPVTFEEFKEHVL